jgi:anthranilate phosphoribosyltransferase
VNSLDGYDEISLTDNFKVFNNQGEIIYTPEELGFNRLNGHDLDGGDTIETAARIFDNVLDNKASVAQIDAVVVNAAFAIRLIEPLKSIEECIALARESIESGRAKKGFEKFVEINS